MAAEIKYGMSVHPTSGLVRSQSDGARAHQVTLPSCDCADFINRRGKLVQVEGGIAVTLCKHIEAFLLLVGGWNRPAEPAPEPAAYENVTRPQAQLILADYGVSVREIGRALNEAMRTGHSRAGRPAGAGGAVPVTCNEYDLFTIPR